MPHIFISYSRKDLIFAGQIVDALEKRGFEIWIDWKGIPKGEELTSEIIHGVQEATAFLFLISPDSVESEWCAKEVALAGENGKKIIPVRIRNTEFGNIPLLVRNRNWINCMDDGVGFNEAIDELVATIHTDYGWLKYHTRIQNKALEWLKKQDSSRLLRGKELLEAEQMLAENEAAQEVRPTNEQRQYVYASRRHETRVRNNLTLVGVFAGIVLLIATVVAIVQRNSAVRNAEVNQSLALAAYAQSASAQNDQDLALALAMESVKISNPPPQAISMLSQIAFEEGTRTVIPVNDEDGVFRIAINSDGSYILSISGAGDIQLWDRKSGREIRRIGDHGTYDGSLAPLVPGVAFTPNSQIAVTAGGEDVRFWDLETGSLIRRIALGKNLGFNVATFSQNAQYLVWGSTDGSVNFWDMNTGREMTRLLDANASPIYSIDLSLDNKFALAGTEDGRVVLWNLETGEKLREFSLQLQRYSGQNLGVFRGVAFSPNGLYVVGAISSGGLEIWNKDTGQLVQHFDSEQIMGTPRFSPDEKYLLVPTSRGVDIWDMASGQLAYRLQGHSGWVQDAAFMTDGRQVVSGSLDGTIRVWDLISETNARFDGHTARVMSLAMSPNDDILLSSSWDGSVRYWDIGTGEELQSIKSVSNSKIRSAVFSPDGKSVLVAEDGVASIFESSGTDSTLSFDGLSLRVPTSIGFIADGNSFYTANLFGDVESLDAPDSTIQIRDIKTGKVNREFFNKGITENIIAVATDHNGKIIVSANMFDSVVGTRAHSIGTINGWDLETGEKVLNIPILRSQDVVNSMIINLDSDLLATGSVTGEISIFDLKSGEPLKKIPAHAGTVTSLTFSKDGALLASSGVDQSVVIWNTSDWTENTILTTSGSGVVQSLVFGDGDARLFGGTDSGTILSWSVNKGLTGTLAWIHGNRYIRPFTCAERDEYNLEEKCDSNGNLPVVNTASQQLTESSTLPYVTPTKQSLETIVTARTNETLYTQQVNGKLTGAPLLYSFEAKHGARLSLLLESNQFDPYMILKDQDGNIIRVSDDDELDHVSDSSILDLEITKSGTYYIIVDGFLHIEEMDNGEFALTLTALDKIGQDHIQIQPEERGLFGMGFIKSQNEPALVSGMYAESAASIAGIKPRDRILSINGVETRDLSERQVWDLVLVPVEMSLDLVTQRNDATLQKNEQHVTMTSNKGSTGGFLTIYQIEPGVKEYDVVEKDQAICWEFMGLKSQEYSVLLGGMRVFTGNMKILASDGSGLMQPTPIGNKIGNLVFTPQIVLPIQPKQDGFQCISIADRKKTAGQSTYTLALQNLINQGNLDFNTTVKGKLSATDGYYWKFTAEKGKLMFLRFDFQDSLVEPYLLLVAPDGSVVGSGAEAIDGFDKFTNEYNYDKYPSNFVVNGYPLPQTGEYTLYVMPYLRSLPVQKTGTYSLSLDVKDARAEKMLKAGKTISTDLTPSEVKIFGYDGKKGEVIRVTVIAAKPASSETSYFAAVEKNLLDTYVIVLDSNGNPLAGSDDFGETTNSQVELTLPADGQYILEVGTYRDFGKGKFSILVEQIQ